MKKNIISGDVAPEFQMNDINSNTISISNQTGKKLYYAFFDLPAALFAQYVSYSY